MSKDFDFFHYLSSLNIDEPHLTASVFALKKALISLGLALHPFITFIVPIFPVNDDVFVFVADHEVRTTPIAKFIKNPLLAALFSIGD